MERLPVAHRKGVASSPRLKKMEDTGTTKAKKKRNTTIECCVGMISEA